MKRATWIIGVVTFGFVMLPADARGDLVTYTFSGTDTATGAVVTGSLTYATNASIVSSALGQSTFADVGTLSIAFAGKTYSTDSLNAILKSGNLLFDGAIGNNTIQIDLATNNFSVQALPARLSFASQSVSTFMIGVGPPPPGPGQTSPDVTLIIAQGTVTSVDFVSDTVVTPEPGTLALGALGMLVLALRGARGPRVR